jgi:hypothetical protein
MEISGAESGVESGVGTFRLLKNYGEMAGKRVKS